MADMNEAGRFKQFFNTWLAEQESQLKELASASRDSQEEHKLGPLIKKVIKHYEKYYKFKSKSAKRDVMIMFSPTWLSSLEKAHHWIAGWRPSMAFHLFYTTSGSHHLESDLLELLEALASGELPTISPEQFHLVDDLQRRTIEEERELGERLAELQEMMVRPAHAAKKVRNDGMAGERGLESVEAALDSKMKGFQEILLRADDLRLRTLEGIVEILRPLQAVDFLIAAAELHLRVHEWGKEMDIRRGLDHV